MTVPSEARVLLEHLFRRQAGRISAYLARVLGPAHLDLAEEAVQEAMLRALQTWPDKGPPENPAAWLFRVAQNAALDAIRRDRMAGEKLAALAVELANARPPEDSGQTDELRDDELRMIFMCCHPEIPPDARVALSLKTVGGFGVPEIARAFLADDATIAQRLVRAKRLIRDRGITLEMPDGEELRARLASVMEVLYFIFNEGYAALEGDTLIRQDLCGEALRFGRLVASSSIATPEVHALVAMIALQAARSEARTDPEGDLIPLGNQDRGRWDQNLIALGFHHFDLAMEGGEVTRYHVEAAIAATHARSAADRVDWPVILELYDQLLAVNASAVVLLNRAVAISKVHGPKEGLKATDSLLLDPNLGEYHLLFAVRGVFLLELERREEAAESFREALRCRCSEPERRFLQRKLAECGSPAS